MTTNIKYALVCIAGVLLLLANLEFSMSFDWFLSIHKGAIFLGLKLIFFIAQMITFFFGLSLVMKDTNHSLFRTNLMLFAQSLVFIFVLIEVVFTFIPHSNHTQISLASHVYRSYYAGPVNAEGFRDNLDLSPNSPRKHNIFFIGDSFTEGDGLKSVEHRFSDKTGVLLGEEYQSYNLGSSGSATTEQIAILDDLPFLPDIIVWQYFFNDIDDICFEQTNSYPNLNELFDLNPVCQWIVERSFLINYFFFRYSPKLGYNEFVDYFLQCGENEQVMQAYANKISGIQDFCQKNDVTLIFLIIPNSFNPEKSIALDLKVQGIFERLQIPYYNSTKDVLEVAMDIRTINSQDMHLSETSNAIIAEKLSRTIKRVYSLE